MRGRQRWCWAGEVVRMWAAPGIYLELLILSIKSESCNFLWKTTDVSDTPDTEEDRRIRQTMHFERQTDIWTDALRQTRHREWQWQTNQRQKHGQKHSDTEKDRYTQTGQTLCDRQTHSNRPCTSKGSQANTLRQNSHRERQRQTNLTQRHRQIHSDIEKDRWTDHSHHTQKQIDTFRQTHSYRPATEIDNNSSSNIHMPWFCMT